MNLFSFSRMRTSLPGNPPPLALPMVAGLPGAAATGGAGGTTAMAAPALASLADPPADAVTAMLHALKDYLLPSGIASLPEPTVAVARMSQRSVGLGDRRGTERQGAWAVVELKGLRLDAVVRFQLWASGRGEVDAAIADLNKRLFIDRDKLRGSGFLRLALEDTPSSESVSTPSSWRKCADYRVLFEYQYQDADQAESLIARIPVHIDSPLAESTTVSDEMVRWDNEAAPTLVVRGRISVGSVSALAFVPMPAPTGTVHLTRTFDGAVGAPAIHPTVPAFLAAVAGPGAPQRHAQVAFASLSNFLATFSGAGDAVTLGDWDTDGTPDEYNSLKLPIGPAIDLSDVADRFEISYQNSAFDKIGVVYLRVLRR